MNLCAERQTAFLRRSAGREESEVAATAEAGASLYSGFLDRRFAGVVEPGVVNC